MLDCRRLSSPIHLCLLLVSVSPFHTCSSLPYFFAIFGLLWFSGVKMSFWPLSWFSALSSLLLHLRPLRRCTAKCCPSGFVCLWFCGSVSLCCCFVSCRGRLVSLGCHFASLLVGLSLSPVIKLFPYVSRPVSLVRLPCSPSDSLSTFVSQRLFLSLIKYGQTHRSVYEKSKYKCS